MPGPDQEVGAYQADSARWPSLWKAQQAFLSATLLYEKKRFDCAANRYYYAVLHTISHWYGYDPTHGQLASRYVKQYGRGEHPAITRAQWIRKQADYTDCPVTAGKVGGAIALVRDFVVRAMKRESVPKRGVS